MKKLFVSLALIAGIIVSAIPFRTSCGHVVNIRDIEGATVKELTNFLQYVNYTECGTYASGFTIYAH